jgi:hypothetical protein
LIPSLTAKHDLELLGHRRAITELAATHPAAGPYANEVMNREVNRAQQAWEVGLTSLLAWVIADDVRRWWARGSHRRALARLAPRRVARRIVRRMDRVVFYERRRELAPRGKRCSRRGRASTFRSVHIWIALELS